MMEQQLLCQQGVTLTTLSSWRDQELSAADARTLAAHVAGCRFCQATMAEFATIAMTLAEQRLPTPDGRLWRGVRDEINRRGRAARAPAMPRVALVGAGTLVVLVLVLAVALLRWHVPATPPVSVVPTVTASPTRVPGSPTATGTPSVQAGTTASATWLSGTLPTGFTYREMFSQTPQSTAFQMYGATAYACVGSNNQQDHLAISHDRGQHWSYLAALPPGVAQCQSFVVATNDPSVLVLSGNAQDGIPAYFSADSGATWQKAGIATIQTVTTFNGNIYAILTNPDPPAAALAVATTATTNGTGNRQPLTVNHSCPCSYPSLVVSHDHLKTWQSIDNGIPANNGFKVMAQFWLNPVTGNLLAQLNDKTCWLSNTGGQQWTALKPPPGQAGFGPLAVKAATSAQPWYLCTNIYCSADNGTSWQPVPPGTAPFAIGADGTLYAVAASDQASMRFYVLPPGATQWQLSAPAPFSLPAKIVPNFVYSSAATGDILWMFLGSEQDQPAINPPYVTIAFT